MRLKNTHARLYTIVVVTVALIAGCQNPIVPLQRIHDDKAETLQNLPGAKNHNKTLRFIEFTDRGNHFDGSDSQLEALIRESKDTRHSTIVVYVHGWHHNAESKDTDLQRFRTVLQNLGEASGFDDKPIIGVYMGWRGEKLRTKGLNLLTYYGRKRTAETVGRTGLRRTLLRLEAEVPESVRLIVIGHSFGTNALLSALQSEILSRALEGRKCGNNLDCLKRSKFGHGVYLFNPALEANQFAALRTGLIGPSFNINQPKLMHVVASRAELRARAAFVLGQTIFNTMWVNDQKNVRLPIGYCNGNELESTATQHTQKPYCTDSISDSLVWGKFDEVDLMKTSVGQFPPYWTGSIVNYKDEDGPQWSFQHIKDGCHSLLLPENTLFDTFGTTNLIEKPNPQTQWGTDVCRFGETNVKSDWFRSKISNHIVARYNDPIQVTVTDWILDTCNGDSQTCYEPSSEVFMKDHNAQLCPNPLAYIAASVQDNELTFRRLGIERESKVPKKCQSGDFDKCFQFYRELFNENREGWELEYCER